MDIHYEGVADVERYVQMHIDGDITPREVMFDNILRLLGSVKPIPADAAMLEVGTGIGWFPCIGKKRGLNLRGLEISPILIEAAKIYGQRKLGVTPDIELGNIETSNIGQDKYDVIICSSVFEHVEYWRKGLDHVYQALKPGGMMFFDSTNKFALTSGEYPPFPLYGWMPDWMRYRFRIMIQGPEIMKNGIDFNQFRYGQLHKALTQTGFREIYDRIQLADPSRMSPLKKNMMSAAKSFPPLRHSMLTFLSGTMFVCVK